MLEVGDDMIPPIIQIGAKDFDSVCWENEKNTKLRPRVGSLMK